jgi:prepilin peptidase CpaA
MLVLLLAVYSTGWMGGGDVKILAVAFLWTGLSGALPFVILLAVFSGAYGLAAKFDWAKSHINESGRRRIPFAPAVAAALIGTFLLRILHLAG